MATTTSNPRPAVAGDIGDTRSVTLAGIADLTAAVSARGIVTYSSDLTVTAELTATIDDPAGTDVTVELGGAGGWLASAAPGVWLLEAEITFADGSVLSWPQAGADTLIVRADLD